MNPALAWGKLEISAKFFSDRVEYFRSSWSLLYCSRQLTPSYCWISSLIAKKSNGEISLVFSAFLCFHQKKKNLDFFPLSLFIRLLDCRQLSKNRGFAADSLGTIKLGCLSMDDGDGIKNVIFKMNSRFFKLTLVPSVFVPQVVSSSQHAQ